MGFACSSLYQKRSFLVQVEQRVGNASSLNKCSSAGSEERSQGLEILCPNLAPHSEYTKLLSQAQVVLSIGALSHSVEPADRAYRYRWRPSTHGVGVEHGPDPIDELSYAQHQLEITVE